MSKIIELKDITMTYDDQVILENFNLFINEKEFLTLLGPSGCGKTTLLRLIGGFITPDSGDIILDGVTITDLPPYQRPLNTVFQKYALFPHLNVYDNIAFGLRNFSSVISELKTKIKRKHQQKLTELQTSFKKTNDKSKKVEIKSEIKELKNLIKSEFLEAKDNLIEQKIKEAQDKYEPLISELENLIEELEENSSDKELIDKEYLNLKNLKQDYMLELKSAKSLMLNKKQIKERVTSALRLVKLDGYENRMVHEMSGGEQQRIAIARAIVNKPRILLLDEPLAALDLKLRKNMQYELKEMQKKLGITFVFVTHDQEEALTMSDRIVVMNKGKIEQIGSPEDIYNEPVNEYVANFIGESNIIKGIYQGDKFVRFLDSNFKCVDTNFNVGEDCNVVIRPEDFDVVSKDKALLTGTILSVIFKGIHFEFTVDVLGTILKVHDYESYKVGDTIYLSVDPYEIHLMKVYKDA